MYKIQILNSLEMATSYSIADYFGANLAGLLSEKLLEVYPQFTAESYIKSVKAEQDGKSYKERLVLHAHYLKENLPDPYLEALPILLAILGEENPEQTGMFKNFYWILPIGKFVETYGQEHFQESIDAIAEITKRSTGEYAIRPFIHKYPESTLGVMKTWAKDDNFHLRRLASEGLRPKLPWASKLDLFVEEPWPVFEILEILKEDPIKFVQKSVANHITDYLKVNYTAARALVKSWENTENKHTKWIIKHATRKIKVD